MSRIPFIVSKNPIKPSIHPYFRGFIEDLYLQGAKSIAADKVKKEMAILRWFISGDKALRKKLDDFIQRQPEVEAQRLLNGYDLGLLARKTTHDLASKINAHFGRVPYIPRYGQVEFDALRRRSGIGSRLKSPVSGLDIYQGPQLMPMTDAIQNQLLRRYTPIEFRKIREGFNKELEQQYKTNPYFKDFADHVERYAKNHMDLKNILRNYSESIPPGIEYLRPIF